MLWFMLQCLTILRFILSESIGEKEAMLLRELSGTHLRLSAYSVKIYRNKLYRSIVRQSSIQAIHDFKDLEGGILF